MGLTQLCLYMLKSNQSSIGAASRPKNKLQRVHYPSLLQKPWPPVKYVRAL